MLVCGRYFTMLRICMLEYALFIPYSNDSFRATFFSHAIRYHILTITKGLQMESSHITYYLHKSSFNVEWDWLRSRMELGWDWKRKKRRNPVRADNRRSDIDITYGIWYFPFTRSKSFRPNNWCIQNAT